LRRERAAQAVADDERCRVAYAKGEPFRATRSPAIGWRSRRASSGAQFDSTMDGARRHAIRLLSARAERSRREQCRAQREAFGASNAGPSRLSSGRGRELSQNGTNAAVGVGRRFASRRNRGRFQGESRDFSGACPGI